MHESRQGGGKVIYPSDKEEKLKRMVNDDADDCSLFDEWTVFKKEF